MVAEDHEGWRLTDEGDEYASKGSPEAIIYNLVGMSSHFIQHLCSYY
jgi:hypothetical protein